MPRKQCIVNLSEDEGRRSLEPTRTGKLSARKLARYHVLLLADEGCIRDFAGTGQVQGECN